jgi:hypothetical protein
VAGTVEVVSALAMVTSLALLASSPQCGQKVWPFSTEAQAWWKRWEMLMSGWHSMNVPYNPNIHSQVSVSAIEESVLTFSKTIITEYIKALASSVL